VSVVLGIQHAIRMRILCSLSGWTFFCTLSLNDEIFETKISELKMCDLIFSTNVVWNTSHSKKNWARYNNKIYIGLHVKYLCSCQTSIKLEFSWQIFRKCSNIKRHENPTTGSRVVLYGRSDTWIERRTDRQTERWTDGQTDRQIERTKLVATFRYFANAPKYGTFYGCRKDYVFMYWSRGRKNSVLRMEKK
jgi:hypothetical protein